MQQTEQYKLNLIEPSDPFLPEALNANTQKVEDVLVEHMEGPVADLDARVTVLEAHKFACGTYYGEAMSANYSAEQFISLPFAPRAVIISHAPALNPGYSAFYIKGGQKAHTDLELLENGFKVTRTLNHGDVYFSFVAFA